MSILLDHETIFYMQEKPWNFIYECLTKKLFFQEKTYETIFYAGEMLETNFQPAPLPASPTHQIGGVGIVNFF